MTAPIRLRIYNGSQHFWKVTCGPLSLSAWATMALGVAIYVSSYKWDASAKQLASKYWKECPGALQRSFTCVALRQEVIDERTKMLAISLIGGVVIIASLYLFSQLCCKPTKYRAHPLPNGGYAFTDPNVAFAPPPPIIQRKEKLI